MNSRYTLTSSVKYDPVDELYLCPESAEGKFLLMRAQQTYQAFTQKYRHYFNLNRVCSITETYAAAIEAGVFHFAHALRRIFFDKDMHFYGVNHLQGIYIENGKDCSIALGKRRKVMSQSHSLSIDTAVKNIQLMMQSGLRHICILSSEDPIRYSPQVLADYLRVFDELQLKEIILHIEPPTDLKYFDLWRNAAMRTSLQFRAFQDTYQRERYAQIHPLKKYGRRRDYHVHYDSLQHARQHGFDNVGLGILFGNYHLPIEEIDALSAQADDLLTKTGKLPARICLLNTKNLKVLDADNLYSLSINAAIPQAKNIYGMFKELIYALTRLAMPSINIINSECGDSALMTELDKYATCTTLARNPDDTITSLKLRGYRPWLVTEEISE